MSATSTATPAYISPNEAAERIGVSRDTIRRRIADGTLPAYRVGSGPRAPIRLDVAAVDALLRPIPSAGGARHA